MPQRQVEAIASTLEGVQAGMNPDQVQAILGEPEAVAHAPGTQCSYYTVLKDFWSRTPCGASRTAIMSATTTAR